MQNHDHHAGHSPEMFRQKFWLTLALTVPVLIYSEFFQGLLDFTPPAVYGADWVPVIFGTIIFFYGGSVFIKNAVLELKDRLPGMMTLISLAIIVAYGYSLATVFLIEGTEFFWELATLITIMLFGHWMEMKSIQSTQGALGELAKLLPDIAERIDGDKVNQVKVSELRPGDIILIRPGSQIPADGQVQEGESAVDESMLTGESKPVKKKTGDTVRAGTVNGAASIKVLVQKSGNDTALAGIMRLVEEAQSSKSRAQVLADRAAFYLTIIAAGSGAITLFAWLSFSGEGAGFALERTVTVLVIACPHALGLAVPLVASISTTKAARNGLLVKRRLALESARNIEVVLFDKTGTLTQGKQGVTDIWPAASAEKEAVLGLAAAAEAESEHIIARAVVAKATSQKIKISNAKKFRSLPGMGVEAIVDGRTIQVGGPELVKSKQADLSSLPQEAINRAAKDGKTIIYILEAGQAIGSIALSDVIRPESYQTIQELKNAGMKIAMLTGDSEEVAGWVAKELGIDEYFAGVLPDKKTGVVKKLQQDGSRVAMVGDGINDAPALVQADIGIAIGAGTDVAIESAGIILASNDPRGVLKIFNLSKATYRKMTENLIWATGYNVVAIPLAAGVLASYGILLAPALGALLMSASTVIVAINAQLLRRVQL